VTSRQQRMTGPSRGQRVAVGPGSGCWPTRPTWDPRAARCSRWLQRSGMVCRIRRRRSSSRVTPPSLVRATSVSTWARGLAWNWPRRERGQAAGSRHERHVRPVPQSRSEGTTRGGATDPRGVGDLVRCWFVGLLGQGALRVVGAPGRSWGPRFVPKDWEGIRAPRDARAGSAPCSRNFAPI
jgi:hypothetical protein